MAKIKLPKMKMAGFLNNRIVLYLALLVSLVYIVKDIYAKNNFNVALFLLIGYHFEHQQWYYQHDQFDIKI